MGKHKLEEYFRDRLSQHEETLDKNELWESLGLEPEPQRRKPFWMYWLVGSGLSLLIGFAIFSYVSIQDSTSVVPEKNLSDAKVEMQNRSIEERASAANNMEVTQAEPTPLRSLSDPDSKRRELTICNI